MSATGIMWTIAGIVFPLLVGAGLTMLGLTPPDFYYAKACFVASAVVPIVASIIWIIRAFLNHLNVYPPLIIFMLITFLINVGLPRSLVWVNKRESRYKTDSEQPKRETLQSARGGEAEELVKTPHPKDKENPLAEEEPSTRTKKKELLNKDQSTIMSPSHQPSGSSKETVSTDLRLRFVYPKAPALLLENVGDSVARDIKWTVVLWNRDLPERNDPLPIPIQTFDWIKEHHFGGAMNLFDASPVSSLLTRKMHLL